MLLLLIFLFIFIFKNENKPMNLIKELKNYFKNNQITIQKNSGFFIPKKSIFKF